MIDFCRIGFIAPSAWGQKKSDIEKGLEKIGLQNVTEEIPSINYQLSNNKY